MRTRALINSGLLCCSMLAASSALAALAPLQEADLADIVGADGIGVVLSNVQLLGAADTTIEIDNDLAKADLFLDHLRLYNYDSFDQGSSVSSLNGISWGTPVDPFRLDLRTANAPKKDGTGTGSFAYLDFALPSSLVPVNSYTFRTNLGKYPEGHPSQGIQRTTTTATPYDCSATTDCATLSFRSRMDVYQVTGSTATSETLALVNRHIQWWEIAGLNLFGTRLTLWNDADKGLGIALRLVAHAETIRSTRSTNTNTSVYTGGSQGINYTETVNGFDNIYNYTIDADEINATAPFSNDDTPNYTDLSKVLTLSDVDVEVYLGQLGYQPLFIEPVFSATSRGAPSGGVVQRDDGVLDLAITLTKLTGANSEHFYAQPKGNISIGNVRISADAAGNCINPGHTICDFGASKIEGLQVQYLQFRTQDLPALTASHCPSGWTCSF